MASGKYFTRLEWYTLEANAIAAGAMDSAYAIQKIDSSGKAGMDTILRFAFDMAGRSDLKPHTGRLEEGAKATILRGQWLPPHGQITPEDRLSSDEPFYHFEVGKPDCTLLADPWGHRLTGYRPYQEYYRVYW